VSGRRVGPISGDTKDGSIDISCFVVNHAAQRSKNYICEQMASVLVSSAVDRGFGSRSGQTKQYTSAASPLRTQYTPGSCCAIGKYIKCLAWSKEKEKLVDMCPIVLLMYRQRQNK
jgi:hypothetical protein